METRMYYRETVQCWYLLFWPWCQGRVRCHSAKLEPNWHGSMHISFFSLFSVSFVFCCPFSAHYAHFFISSLVVIPHCLVTCSLFLYGFPSMPCGHTLIHSHPSVFSLTCIYVVPIIQFLSSLISSTFSFLFHIIHIKIYDTLLLNLWKCFM